MKIVDSFILYLIYESVNMAYSLYPKKHLNAGGIDEKCLKYESLINKRVFSCSMDNCRMISIKAKCGSDKNI